MGKSFVSKGKNIDDAVNIALQFLHTDQNDVDIEIIENESKGIWGLGAKPAVVRVTVKSGQSDEPELSESPALLYDMLEKLERELVLSEPGGSKTDFKPAAHDSDLFGKVWVRDGHIFCKEAPEAYPLISPCKEVKLFINDELVEETTVVSENFLIHVELRDEVKEPEWELKFSDDQMSVALKVIPGFRIQRRLKDKAPEAHIQLEYEERQIPLIIETAPIMDKLKEMGVVFGIDYAEIAAACTAEKAGMYVIAKGSPPRPGKNGRFMPIQETEIKKGLKERTDGSVDFREIQEFPTVLPGQVLGNILPPVAGIHGTSVTNGQVAPPDVYPLIVQEGKGVSLVDEGTKIIATNAGHPEIFIKGQLAKISIVPKIVIGKDVSLETGNVHYAGAVDVQGSVQDGMCVEAEGDVQIRTNVNMAKVTAGGSIIVQKNIISSQITAGNRNMMLAEVSQLLAQIVEQIKKMTGAISQLSQVSAFKVSSFARTGLGPLIKILCDGKFKTFPPLMAAFTHKIKSNAEWLDAEWIKLCADLHKGFIVAHSAEIMSVDDILIMIHRAEELIASSGSGPETDCFIKAEIVHNSQVYSGGDVYIVGQGVYSSKLYAGGKIRVEGYVRGGEIHAEEGIYIEEAGTRGGIATKISVPKDESIRIRLALEDTIIQVGTKTHRFLEETRDVHGRLDGKGELRLH